MPDSPCAMHGESLARIETQLEDLVERMDRLNGSVARHESRLNNIELANAKAEGRRGGSHMILMWAVTLLGLVFAGWQGLSAHQQTAAAVAALQQAQR